MSKEERDPVLASYIGATSEDPARDVLDALEKWRQVTDYIIDQVWVILNLFGSQSFKYTTAKGHSVRITIESLAEE